VNGPRHAGPPDEADTPTRDDGTDPSAQSAATGNGSADPGSPVDGVVTTGDLLTDTLALAETRLADLQRERAEFVNFRRRAERDIAAARDSGVSRIVEGLLPVLDDISLARTHGDLDGPPFAAIAEKLDATLARFGVEVFGTVGDAFDPTVHEALLHEALPEEHAGSEVAIVTRVLQPGYRLGERVLRPARVAVADPS
jgi:molecular chaperone GrpE